VKDLLEHTIYFYTKYYQGKEERVIEGLYNVLKRYQIAICTRHYSQNVDVVLTYHLALKSRTNGETFIRMM